MSTTQIRFPGESPDYRRARDDLLGAEVDLRRAIEEVAAAWGTELSPADEGQNERHVDFIWPLWNLLDATPRAAGPRTSCV